MVTAVEPNMVGILRRLHLHPMDAALNEFSSQVPIAHLKFNPHSFLFKNQAKQEDDQFHLEPASKRPPPCSVQTDPPNKKNRRKARLAFRHSHQSVPCINYQEKNESVPSEQHVLGLAGLNPSSIPMCSPSEYLLPPPILSTPTPLLGKRSPTHGTPSWLAYPPTLSNPKTPVVSGQQSMQLNCKHSNIEPILSTAASLLQLRTPLSRAEVNQPQMTPIQLGQPRRRTPSTTSMGENLSEASESTASMPNVSSAFRSLDPGKRPSPPNSSEPLGQDSSSLRLRSATRAAKFVPSSEHNQLTSRQSLSVKTEIDTSLPFPKPLKRRRSFEQLTDPSIHDSPNPVFSNKPRERRQIQMLQHESQTSPTMHLPVDMSYLHATEDYFLPCFTRTKSSDFPHDRLVSQVLNEEQDTYGDINTETPLIEVPNWRIFTLDNVKSDYRSKKPTTLDTPDSTTDAARGVRARRASVTDQTSSAGKNKLNGEGVKTGTSSTIRGSSVLSEEEDTSDAAYLVRHSKLETEEIRRERRSRQHSMEQELKLRWEQRDRASWQKRQPQSRMDPLAKYNPQDRMPTHLTPAFNQVRQIHVCDSLPVIAFGCRIPIASVQPFKRI